MILEGCVAVLGYLTSGTGEGLKELGPSEVRSQKGLLLRLPSSLLDCGSFHMNRTLIFRVIVPPCWESVIFQGHFVKC